MATVHMASAAAPTNIAVVKYWGKRDAALNLPVNSSLSVTLDQSDLRTLTSVAASTDFEEDCVWLNGRKEDVEGNKRLVTVFREMRARAGDRRGEDGEVIVRKEDWAKYKIHVVSENSFPTAAGLASSASGYACLVRALAELLCVEETFPGELSEVARMGSGSASRSLYGGYARWSMGERKDGRDSVASQVAPLEHWDSMHALICVVSDHKKTTSSTGGMIDSVRTSALLGFRAREVVPQRMKDMEAAIQAKDFEAFAELTMRDSNQFHATCLDTFPPIKYMNDTSHAISALVHEINAAAGRAVCAYTFDAGPNAVIFLEEADVPSVLEQLLARFGPSRDDLAAVETTQTFVRGRTTKSLQEVVDADPDAASQPQRGAVKYVIHTKVGPGAQALPISDEETFLMDAQGLPKRTEA